MGPVGARPGVSLAGAVAALALVLAIAAGGWYFIQRVSDYGREQERDDLAAVAAVAAAALDPHDIAQLQGTAADAGSEVLARVRARLRRVHDDVADARFVYLVALRQGEIVFLADAEPADSRDYSPPGEVYTEAPDEFRQAFSSAAPLVHGPYRDRWGDWITGLAALPGPQGGPAPAVLGIDVSAKRYSAAIAGFRLFAQAIVGLFAISAVLSVAVVWIMRRFNARLQNDLIELRRAQERLRLAAAVIESTAEGVMVTDAGLQIESVNRAFEQITGYAAAEVVGQTPKILYSGRHDDAFFQRLRELIDTQDRWRGEIWNRRRDGEVYPQQTSVSVLRGADGRISHYATVFSDNTAQNQLEAKLREMSAVDGLTGIANRRAFDEVLAQEWARALRDRGSLSLLMADIDNFKAYNDRHGHLEGDRCLQQVAQAINAAANRASDLVARYGGEEFAVILPAADAAAAARMAEKIRAAVAALALPHGGSDVAAVVTISVGVATALPRQATRQLALIGAADRALYQAKRAGRNCVVSASADAADERRDATGAPADGMT